MKLERARRKKDNKMAAIVTENAELNGKSVLKTKDGKTKTYDFGYEDK